MNHPLLTLNHKKAFDRVAFPDFKEGWYAYLKVKSYLEIKEDIYPWLHEKEGQIIDQVKVNELPAGFFTDHQYERFSLTLNSKQ